MANDKFQNRYRISSARAPWHAYDGGAYFVTVCTKNRQHFFGEITDGEMHLTTIGQIVADNLQNVTTHYPYADITVSQVMPNHLHAIVFIDGNKIPYTRRSVASNNDAPGTNAADNMDILCRDVERHVSTMIPTENDLTGKNKKMQEIANKSGWLSVCIGGIKSAVTKYAHATNIDFKWQSRFHDHIIRDANEMIRIANYIENNVAQWESDSYYNR